MNQETNAQLEADLASLTEWSSGTPGLWRRALRDAPGGGEATSDFVRRFFHTPIRPMVLASVAVVVLAMLTSMFVVPQFGGRPTVGFANTRGVPAQSRRPRIANSTAEPEPLASLSSLSRRLAADADGDANGDFDFPSEDMGGYRRGAYAGPQGVANQTGGARQVVRKASIEFVTDDVRAAFLKAAYLIREADGEFVQDSALTGSGATAQANLTLRVAAGRLGEVLNELRQLGTVETEKKEGQDVTTQVVDLEARLRNETRVEQELLALFDSRKNAPLKEILELRDHLGRVRQTIEQLGAQRERLGRLVSLATVLVIIRAEDAPPPATPGLGAYFGEAIQNAWLRGMTFLSDTIAALLALLVGGLIWWLLLIAAVLVAVRRAGRRASGAAGS